MTNAYALPPMRPAGPIRVSDDVFDNHPAYPDLLRNASATGCCPVWLTDFDPVTFRPPDDASADLARIETIDVAAMTADHWGPSCLLCGCRDPFDDTFPGLAPPGDAPENAVAEAVRARALHLGHLAVVPVERPADVITAIGWSGPCNRSRDLAELSAVLRTWEERFGALVVRVDRATLWLSVAAPPRTLEHACHVAAEHFTFCPDVDWEDPRPLRKYAADLVDAHTWRFWWD